MSPEIPSKRVTEAEAEMEALEERIKQDDEAIENSSDSRRKAQLLVYQAANVCVLEGARTIFKILLGTDKTS